ncbi:neurofilament medium polypeptide-like [Ptychodera flava]|uniref:neurofilament medium polypeptide-like n=1 Tax=Ptychodera flava TaxID=63121 RepID=UPI00396A3A63
MDSLSTVDSSIIPPSIVHERSPHFVIRPYVDPNESEEEEETEIVAQKLKSHEDDELQEKTLIEEHEEGREDGEEQKKTLIEEQDEGQEDGEEKEKTLIEEQEESQQDGQEQDKTLMEEGGQEVDDTQEMTSIEQQGESQETDEQQPKDREMIQASQAKKRRRRYLTAEDVLIQDVFNDPDEKDDDHAEQPQIGDAWELEPELFGGSQASQGSQSKAHRRRAFSLDQRQKIDDAFKQEISTGKIFASDVDRKLEEDKSLAEYLQGFSRKQIVDRIRTTIKNMKKKE